MTKLVTRRSVLVGGLAAGAALAFASGISLGPRADGFQVLSRDELAVVAAISLVMFPGHPFPLNGVEAGVVEEVDRMVAHDLPEVHGAAFRYLLRALEWGTLMSRGTRFSALGDVDRLEVLRVWSDPTLLPRRIAADSLRMVLGGAYFSNATIQQHMGYRAACGRGNA